MFDHGDRDLYDMMLYTLVYQILFESVKPFISYRRETDEQPSSLLYTLQTLLGNLGLKKNFKRSGSASLC